MRSLVVVGPGCAELALTPQSILGLFSRSIRGSRSGRSGSLFTRLSSGWASSYGASNPQGTPVRVSAYTHTSRSIESFKNASSLTLEKKRRVRSRGE